MTADLHAHLLRYTHQGFAIMAEIAVAWLVLASGHSKAAVVFDHAEVLEYDSPVLRIAPVVCLSWSENTTEEQIVVSADPPTNSVWTPCPEPMFRRGGRLCVTVPVTQAEQYFKAVPGTQFSDDFNSVKEPFASRNDWGPLFFDPTDAARFMLTLVNEAFQIETVTRPVDGQVARGSGPSDRSIVGLAPGQRLRALVVDDVPENREVLSEMLQGIRCTVEVAADGIQALACLQSSVPDVVFLDIRMPGIDGIEVARRIRAGLGPGRTKLVAISASAFAHEQRRYLKAGFDAFLAKPFRFEQLCDCPQRLLRIEFEYAHAGRERRTGGDEIDLRQVRMPAEVRQRLTEAADRCSATQLEEGLAALERRGEEERRVAGHLRRLLDEGDFAGILAFLEPGPGGSDAALERQRE